MNRKQLQVLKKTAEALDSNNIVWGVGASMLLSRYGLADTPGDIDIVVSLDDIDKVDSLLSTFATTKDTKEKSDIYLTDFFYEYIVDSVDIDVMAGFKIKLPDSVFEYRFDEESVPHTFDIDGTKVPFMTLEDWYVLYLLMPGREYKAELVEKYFEKNGIKYPYLLKREVCNLSLPESVRDKIKRLLMFVET